MIRGSSIRQLYESDGPAGFVKKLLHLMGYCDLKGRRYLTEAGNATFKNPKDASGKEIARIKPSEYSLRDLAFSVMGPGAEERFTAGNIQRASLIESIHPLREATGSMAGGIGASTFADINAFTGVVAGLLEISLMEGWESPEFVMSELMPDENTKMFEGRKVIGVSRLGDVAEERLPGMPTKRAQIGERWITQPRTVENALATEVYQETVFLDLTGQVLQEANDTGTWLRWRKEIRCIDAWLGVVNSVTNNNTYTYKGTQYNTYISLGYFNNTFSNELLHWDNVQSALLLFRDMIDPETGLRVMIEPDTAIVNMEKLVLANAIFGTTGMPVQVRDAPGATTGQQNVAAFANPYQGRFKIIQSPLIYQRMTDANGLNLSGTDAGKRWYLTRRGKAMKYAQNWPFRTQTAAPNQVDMLDRGVVLYTKSDERGAPMIVEPRNTVQCTA